MSYQWKEGSHVKGDAELAAKVCKELEAQGNLNAAALVEASKAEDAPLHDMFEWDDTVAAQKYREVQAREIIRSITVVTEDRPLSYRQFSSVGNSVYVSTTSALSRDETRKIVLSTAMRELEAFRRKYQTLSELLGLFSAIDEVLEG